jgi:hypothetical protein
MIAAAWVSLGSGCNFNLFAPMDSPHTDTQNLSAARAAFDRGDYADALKYYQALSGSYADIQASEEAFMQLAQAGVPMSAFIGGFGDGGKHPGNGVTVMASNVDSSGSTGINSRQAILTAYSNAANISNTQLQGITRFLASLALISEVLAEGGTAGASNFSAAQITTNAVTCANDSLSSCVIAPGDSNCDSPGTDGFGAGTCTQYTGFDASTFANWSGFQGSTPTLCMVDAGIQAVANAVSTFASGNQNTAQFTQVLTAAGTAGLSGALSAHGYPCYRLALLSEGVGFLNAGN